MLYNIGTVYYIEKRSWSDIVSELNAKIVSLKKDSKYLSNKKINFQQNWQLR